MPKRDVVGIGKCQVCSSLVELRINSGRKVYYFCDGQADDTACQDFHRWNDRVSAGVISEAARVGWLGPIPYGYFPPTKSQGNTYAHHEGKNTDHEQLREAEPYVPKRAEKRAAQRDSEPAPAPEPEPVEPAPEPERKPGGTEPKRRRIL